MGLMLNGQYFAEDPGPETTEGGEFQRAKATIRNWITSEGPFRPEPAVSSSASCLPGRFWV